MNFSRKSLIGVVCCFWLTGAAIASPQAKAYQVTGPIVEVTDTYITVKKGDDLWQVARDAGTRIKGDLKVGAKVTIQYRVVALDVEVKAEKSAKPVTPSK